MINIPSAILISFIGTGQRTADGMPAGYQETTYRMPDGKPEPTSMFGAAMLRWLLRTRIPVKKWLVLGTAGSNWSELRCSLQDRTARDSLLSAASDLDLWCRQHGGQTALDNPDTIKQAQERVSHWTSMLAERLNAGVDVIGRVIGPCSDLPGQRELARRLLEAVDKGAEIYFDVSHGFRHLPLLAAFVVPFLRYARDVRNVEFYSGAFEMRSRPDASAPEETPVISLPLCMEFLEATEHAATFENTGSMLPVIDGLTLQGEDRKTLVAVAMADETNQPVTQLEAAKSALRKLEKSDAPAQPVLAEMLLEKLGSFAGDDVSRMLSRAIQAREKRQFLKAATLIYEALQRKIVRLSGLTLELVQKKDKEDPTPDWKPKSPKAVLKHAENLWPPDQKELLNDLFWLRNRLAHASDSSRPRIDAAVRDPEEMKALLAEVVDLVDRVHLLPGVLRAKS